MRHGFPFISTHLCAKTPVIDFLNRKSNSFQSQWAAFYFKQQPFVKLNVLAIFSSSELGRFVLKGIDFLFNESAGRDMGFTFFGGEPLLNFSVLKSAIKKNKTSGMKRKIGFSITTFTTSV